MEHFICTGGCGGVASEAGVCGAETCPKHGVALESCSCADGKHGGKIDNDEAEEPQ